MDEMTPSPDARLNEALRQALGSGALLDALPVGICCCDRNGVIWAFNRRATELWGRSPVQGRQTPEILEKVRQGDWPPPRQVKPGVEKALDAVCRKAMALKPEDRYSSPRELAGEIERFLADEPVTAYREPFRVRAGRWCEPHRAGPILRSVPESTAGRGRAMLPYDPSSSARRSSC